MIQIYPHFFLKPSLSSLSQKKKTIYEQLAALPVFFVDSLAAKEQQLQHLMQCYYTGSLVGS